MNVTPTFLLSLLGHPYLSGMWFGVAPKMDTKKTHVLQRVNCMLKTGNEYSQRDLYAHLNKHERIFILVNPYKLQKL